MAKKKDAGSSSGLTASDASGVLEIREDNARQIADAIDQALARANIYCIDIDRFTGKQRA